MKIAFQIVGRVIFYSLLFAMVFVGLFLFVFYGDEKIIPPQNIRYIEDAIESSGKNVQAYIGSAKAHFEGFNEGFTLILSNSYINLGEDIIISTPEMKAKLKLSDLLVGRISFREISLEKPQFLFKASTGSEYFDVSSEDSILSIYKNSVYNLFEVVNKEKNIIPVESVTLNKAIFSFNRDNKYQNWKINRAKLSFYKLQNSTYLRTEINTNIRNLSSTISADARVLKDNKLKMDLVYANLPASAFAEVVSELKWLYDLNPILYGKAEVMLDQKSDSSVISVSSNLEFQQKWLKKSKITFASTLDLISAKEDKTIKPKIKGRATVENLKMKNLEKLWPEKYGTEIRSEVLKNYSKGIFNAVSVNFGYDFANTKFDEITREEISAEGDIKDADIIFNPRYPTLEKVNGKFSLSDDNLSINVTKGFIGKFKFGATEAKINDISKERSVIEIQGTGKGSLAELKPLITAINKGRDKEYFYNTHEISANSNIKFYYRDNANNGFDSELFKLDLTAKLSKIKVKDVLKNINFAASKGKMVLDSNGMTLEAEGIINETSPANVTVWAGFHQDNDVEINIKSRLSAENIALIITDYKKYFEGNIKFEAQYKSLGNDNSFAANADFKDSKINFPYLSIDKNPGEEITATFNGRFLGEKAIEINNFRINSEQGISQGNAIIARESKTIADEFYFSRLITGKNNSSLYVSIENKPDRKSYKIKILGNSFDLSKFIEKYQELTGSEPIDINLELDVKKLFLASNVALNNASGYLKCANNICLKGAFNGAIDGTKNGVSISYLPEDINAPYGIRKLNFYTDNAGRLTEGLGFYAHIEGGEASIEGHTEPSDNSTSGIIKMKDYRITKAPVLARIFSLASFTGIADILTGDGVPMKNLEGSFIAKKEYLSLKNVVSYGNSLGLTTRGTINLKTSEVDLTGYVTPSYSVNSLFSKIPILNFITGKKGEGLIATKYSVKGKYPDTDVSVNPLSALTPGFLREIWGNAETNIDKKTEEDNESERKNFKSGIRPSSD